MHILVSIENKSFGLYSVYNKKNFKLSAQGFDNPHKAESSEVQYRQQGGWKHPIGVNPPTKF